MKSIFIILYTISITLLSLGFFILVDNFTNTKTNEKIIELEKRVDKIEQYIINNYEVFYTPIDATECVRCYEGVKQSVKYKTIKGGEMVSPEM